tara:strand:- start:121 stop:609 length:489 start_codon:yes stop_codon:yes gene_type:complete
MPVKIHSDSGSVTLQAEDVSGNSTATLVNVPAKIGHAEICIACSDETTALSGLDTKATFLIPRAMTLVEVKASLTAHTSGDVTVDVNYHATDPSSAATIFSGSGSQPTITGSNLFDSSGTGSVFSGSSSTYSLAEDGFVTIDLDAAGTGAKGLKVWLLGYWS